MILGLSIANFTLAHVIISLVGIVSGLIFLFGLMGGQRRTGWLWLFYLTTFLTCATGYLFPFNGFGPPQIVGILTVIALGVAAFALTRSRRAIFIIGSILALYFNCFVGVTQAFQKISFLQVLAPTQTERPFLIAQAVLLGLVIIAAIVSLIRYRPITKAAV